MNDWYRWLTDDLIWALEGAFWAVVLVSPVVGAIALWLRGRRR